MPESLEIEKMREMYELVEKAVDLTKICCFRDGERERMLPKFERILCQANEVKDGFPELFGEVLEPGDWVTLENKGAPLLVIGPGKNGTQCRTLHGSVLEFITIKLVKIDSSEGIGLAAQSCVPHWLGLALKRLVEAEQRSDE